MSSYLAPTLHPRATPSNFALTLSPGVLTIAKGADKGEESGTITLTGATAVLQELASQFGGARPGRDGKIAWRELGGHVNFTAGSDLRALLVAHEGPMIMLGASPANCAVREYDSAGVRFISVGGLAVTAGGALVAGAAGAFTAPLSSCFLE